MSVGRPRPLQNLCGHWRGWYWRDYCVGIWGDRSRFYVRKSKTNGKLEHKSHRPQNYRATVLGGGAGAGLANFAASIVAFGCTSLSSVVDWPSVHVMIHLKGSLTPATSR
jgi:hypothetical protein